MFLLYLTMCAHKLGHGEGDSVSDSELSQLLWSPPATSTFLLVILDFCWLHASLTTIQLSVPSGHDVLFLSVC